MTEDIWWEEELWGNQKFCK